MRKLVNSVLAGALGLSIIAGVSAQSDSGNASIEITSDASNTLTVTISNAEFEAKPYSFDSQSSTGDLTINVTDNRGTNEGWTFNLKADGDLSNSDESESIPLSGLSLAAATDSTTNPAEGQDPTPITRNALNPVTTTGAVVLSAPEGEGAGDYEFDVEGTLNIPAGQVVDTYSTTLTIEVPAAP